MNNKTKTIFLVTFALSFCLLVTFMLLFRSIDFFSSERTVLEGKSHYVDLTDDARPSVITTTVQPTFVPHKITFSHKQLPGFSFDYLSDWLVEVKEFGQSSDEQQSIACDHRACFGIRLEKENTLFELTLYPTYDDDTYYCSNTAKIVSLSDDWYRIISNNGQYYTNQIQEKVTTSSSPPQTFGKVENEWSVLPNTHYKFCVTGLMFTKEHSKVEGSQSNPLEFSTSYIDLNTDPQIVEEVDKMITSIQGVR